MPDVVSALGPRSTDTSDAGHLVELLASHPARHADAACREAPAEVTWFVELDGNARAAKEVCGRCLGTGECRGWAMAQGPELDGLWGGLTRAERAIERRRLTA